MKTIIVTLIAAVLAVCATVRPPVATAETTPTIERPPTVAAENTPVELQAEEPAAPQSELTDSEPQAEPNQPMATAEPEPTPTPQETIITEEEKLEPIIEVPEPATEEPVALQLPTEEPTIAEHTKTDAEIIIEHAKPGYEDKPPAEPPAAEPEPPTQVADISTAVAVAEAFAIETYGVTIDSSLDFTNSAFRFPAVVPLIVDQETLNYKAVDIVNYTFQQQIRQHGVTLEKIHETGIRCKVHVVQSEYDYQIYCCYA